MISYLNCLLNPGLRAAGRFGESERASQVAEKDKLAPATGKSSNWISKHANEEDISNHKQNACHNHNQK